MAGQVTGTVAEIVTYASTGTPYARIRANGTVTGQDPTRPAGYFHIDLSSVMGQAQFRHVMTAWAMGAAITIYGAGGAGSAPEDVVDIITA